MITSLWSIREAVIKDTSDESLRQLILGSKTQDEKGKLYKDVWIALEKHDFTIDENVVNVALALYIKVIMMEKR